MQNRCHRCNLKNQKYIDYHDKEWGVRNMNEQYLFEILILELFQSGLSWECVLNKREAFKTAYYNFDLDKVCNFGDEKIIELEGNAGIIRNKLKIYASIKNAQIFKKIQKEFGTFHQYLYQFTNDKIIFEVGKISNSLSDQISKDLKIRGMNFVGSVIIYSYLQAIGVINSHDKNCFLYKNARVGNNIHLAIN